MSRKSKKTVGKTTKQLWDESVDYTSSSLDRPYKYRLENGVLIHLNLEQYKFMMETNCQERREKYINNRCNILAERGGLKKCKDDCGTCPWFMTKKTNGGQVSFDLLYAENEFEQPDNNISVLEEMLFEEIYNHLMLEIKMLDDCIDGEIMKLLINGKTEREVSIILNIPKSTIHEKKAKLFKLFSKKLKNL